jgi:acetyl-CoA carboxylase biotin carboxyl carrier protein
VRYVLGVVRGTRIAEIEVEWQGGRVRVRREPGLGAAADAEGIEPTSLGAPGPDDGKVVVHSPYVGIFHRDDARPWPQVGELVAAGEAVGEVETMRIRNSVPSPSAGRLHELLVQSGAPVEYGQPLVVIGPPEATEGMEPAT